MLVAGAREPQETLSERGTLARLGCEEFAIVLFAAGATRRWTRPRNFATRSSSCNHNIVGAGQVTASIGVAWFDGQGSRDDWMRAIDRALYAAKARGSNCVVEATSVRVRVA